MSNPPVRSRTRPVPYAVGYKKPPVHSQFKPGQSGKPSGRPKGSTSLISDVEKVMSGKRVAIIDGRRITLTTRQGVLRRLAEQSLKGHLASAALLFKLEAMQAFQTDAGAPTNAPAPQLSAEERRLLSDHLARMKTLGGED